MKFEKPSSELAVQHRYWPMDEDCLNLNIWTPACDDRRRPVLVWLHGGAFFDGSSIEQLAYDGAAFSEYADAVVVSVNHRLNILGFFDLSEYGDEYRNSGNNGLMDIVCALQWIRENIEAFGGDKDQVTLMGQSGGGSKITCLLQTPAADGLYARCINMSGVLPSLMPDEPGSTRALADAMMRELGISSVKEMETVPWRALFDAYLKLKPEYEKQGCSIGCTAVKNDYFLGDPVTNGFRRETSHIPLVAGTCFGEFFAFEPLMHDRNDISEEEALEMLRTRMGRAKAQRIVPLFK
jgi:para-nitrobenzyl esterase